MKKNAIQIITQNGISFGQVSKPDDVIKVQDFLHERISDLTVDFLNNQRMFEIFGFNYALGEGNAFNIEISKPGRVYVQQGKSYELLIDTTLTIAEADSEFPRLDAVIAVLEDNVDAETALIPFVQLRTSGEFGEGVLPYSPQNLNTATEKHFRAIVQIRTGTPSETPTMPTLNSNEVALYLIAVAPNTAQINDTEISDMRDVVRTLRQLNDQNGQSKTDIAELRALYETLSKLGDFPADFGRLFGMGSTTLKNILQQLQLQSNASRDLPEIRYDNPKLPLTNPNSSKIIADGYIINGTAVIDVEIGGRINFGNTDVILHPDKFPAEVNARFEEAGTSAEHDSNEQAITLNTITLLDADGALEVVPVESEFSAPRSYPAAAARDERYIEILGGLAQNNQSALSEWLTYDRIADTLTPRTPSINLPTSNRPAAFTFGDGTNILYIAGNSGNQTPQAFKINATTGAATAIATTKPTGKYFFGDLIAEGKIFIVAVGSQTTFWEYDTATNIFTQLGVTGNIPVCNINYCSGCFLDENLFVLQTYTSDEGNSGKTFYFDRTNLEWTQLNIAQPIRKQAIKAFRMANVNGRPTLIAASETTANTSVMWELIVSRILYYNPENSPFYEQNPLLPATGQYWKIQPSSFQAVQNAGFCSTLNTGFSRGNAVVVGGQGKFANAQKKIYRSVQGGLVYTTHNGSPAVTIAPASTFAKFLLPIYEANWDVAGYLLNLQGSFDETNLKAEVSFDDGETFVEVKPNRYMNIANSNAPGMRHLRITLYNLTSNKPILSKLNEIFDQDGIELEQRTVIRYDAPVGINCLYVAPTGEVTLSETIEPSTPSKCLLHKITNEQPADPPEVKSYINRRRPHIKYSKTKTGVAVSTQFDNELAVPARYVDCRAFKADKTLYHLDDVVPTFDSLISVAGVVTDGDIWIVELEG